MMRFPKQTVGDYGTDDEISGDGMPEMCEEENGKPFAGKQGTMMAVSAVLRDWEIARRRPRIFEAIIEGPEDKILDNNRPRTWAANSTEPRS